MLRHKAGNGAQGNRWFEQAVFREGPFAAYQAGFLLSHEAKTASASTAWFKRAAEMGHRGGMSSYAHRLAEGIGVAKNSPEAFRWRLKASSHPQADGYDLLAQAKAYDEGAGTARNPRAALAALKAAERKRIDDSDTRTPQIMNEMQARLEDELSSTGV